MEATFRVGGLATGLDTNNIIEQLTNIESLPLNRLRQRQSAFQTQISSLGDIASKLKALQSAAKKLSDNGALGAKATTTNEAFTATPGTGAVAGRYDVTVSTLATNARALSGSFGSGATAKEGSLKLTLSGDEYDVAIAEGDSLATIAANIKASGAPVTAVVLNNGTNDFLSIVAKNSGHTIGEAASTALEIEETYTGATGTELGLAVTEPTNSTFNVNGLDFERRSNSVTDAVPGTTLLLKEQGGAQETLIVENDSTATSGNLKEFVDAYNRVMQAISVQLRPSAASDRNVSLAGDGALRSLQTTLQGLLTAEVTEDGDVKTLADVGFKTSQANGTVSIDATALSRALSNDAPAVNTLFSTASTGLSDLVDEVADRFTNTTDGILTARTKGINAQVRSLDRSIGSMQLRIEGFRENLIRQFTTMEQVVSGLRATGNFLNLQQLGTL